VLSIAVLLTCSACSSVRPLDIRTSPVEFQTPPGRPTIPNPRPIETDDVEFVVVTPETLPEGDNWVLYAVTADDYETLSRNMGDILRWVVEASWRLRYYRGEEDISESTDGRSSAAGLDNEDR